MRDYDEFVKEAATRWKKELGNVSAKSEKILRKQVAKPAQDYIAGLERGNEALIKKLGVQTASHRDGKTISKFLREKVDPSASKAETRFETKIRQMSGASSTPSQVDDSSLIVGFKNRNLHPDRKKVTSGKVVSLFKKRGDGNPVLKRLPLSSQNRRAFDALTLRHEIDEARSIKNHGLLMGYESHNAPDVIHRESANLALMPRRVREMYTGARKEKPVIKPKRLRDFVDKKVSNIQDDNTREVIRKLLYRGGEANSLASQGIKYGGSAYYDKKKASKHVHDFALGNDVKYTSTF